MDNVTHALAGLLLAEATISVTQSRRDQPASPGFRSTAIALGIITAELPDADLVYAGPMLGMGKLGYLLHHRGHTHTVLFAVVTALLVWAGIAALRGREYKPLERGVLLGLALAGTLSHLVLDYTNSYGVHPFWPADRSWYYGDAVFIVEPWLWVIAVPPLLLLARRRMARVLLGLALAGILGAAWAAGMVDRSGAIALTAGAVIWFVTVRATPPSWRVALGLVAWVMIEGMFFAASHAGRAIVRSAVADTAAIRDIVLTPAVGNPLCAHALIVETDSVTYRVTSATVATVPSIREVHQCGGDARDTRNATRTSSRSSTHVIRWANEWIAQRAELHAMANTHCEFAAALQFMRVPMWRRMPDGTIHLVDLRYERDNGGGFASLMMPARPAGCPEGVPGWKLPRDDVVGLL
jgi:inner membrane protein